MRLDILHVLDREICHFADAERVITSIHSTVFVKSQGDSYAVQLPSNGCDAILGKSRLLRRAFRLDKCNTVPVDGGLVIIRQGKVFHYFAPNRELTHALSLRDCRNVLHQSIAVVDGAQLYFGEYGRNTARKQVPVYRSLDAGRSWETIFEFPAGKIRHVHGCYYDPFEKRIWILTGDYDGECHILCSDTDFQQVEWIGDGTQTYRACNVFFEADSVHWIMDSPSQDSFHIRLDRKTRRIHRGQRFPGPVWYIKRLVDGYYLAATANEIGAGVKDGFVHLMVSRDLEDWKDVHQFRHDGLPKGCFKFGVVGFPDGSQSSRAFYLFAEAVRGLDGKTALCSIE